MPHAFHDGGSLVLFSKMPHDFQDGGSLFLVDEMADDVHGDGEDDGGILLCRNRIQRLKQMK